jgi:hypothetical protein
VSTARFLPAARLEFLPEVIYYNSVQAGLGGRFASAIEEATARALAFPAAGAPRCGNTRRVMRRACVREHQSRVAIRVGVRYPLRFADL